MHPPPNTDTQQATAYPSASLLKKQQESNPSFFFLLPRPTGEMLTVYSSQQTVGARGRRKKTLEQHTNTILYPTDHSLLY